MWGGVGIVTPPVHRRAGRQHAGVRGGLAGNWGLRGESETCGYREAHDTATPPGALMESMGIPALTGVARWVGHLPTNTRVMGSIPGQGICLGCRPGH